MKTIKKLGQSLGMGVEWGGVKAKALLSIPRDMGVEYGQGSSSTAPFIPKNSSIPWIYLYKNL